MRLLILNSSIYIMLVEFGCLLNVIKTNYDVEKKNEEGGN